MNKSPLVEAEECRFLPGVCDGSTVFQYVVPSPVVSNVASVKLIRSHDTVRVDYGRTEISSRLHDPRRASFTEFCTKLECLVFTYTTAAAAAAHAHPPFGTIFCSNLYRIPRLRVLCRLPPLPHSRTLIITRTLHTQIGDGHDIQRPIACSYTC